MHNKYRYIKIYVNYIRIKYRIMLRGLPSWAVSDKLVVELWFKSSAVASAWFTWTPEIPHSLSGTNSYVLSASIVSI